MSNFEVSYELGGDYGDCVTLNKHGDRYSLVASRKGKSDGTVWMEWAFPQTKDKTPRDKAIPLGVRLGDRITAIGALRWALKQLEGEGYGVQVEDLRGKDDDPPF